MSTQVTIYVLVYVLVGQGVEWSEHLLLDSFTSIFFLEIVLLWVGGRILLPSIFNVYLKGVMLLE